MKVKSPRSLTSPLDGCGRKIEARDQRPTRREFLAHHAGTTADLENRAPPETHADHTQAGLKLLFHQIFIETSTRMRPNDLKFRIALFIIEMTLSVVRKVPRADGS